MKVEWEEYLRYHWPIIALVGMTVVSGIYAMGFEAGKMQLLNTALIAGKEAQHG